MKTKILVVSAFLSLFVSSGFAENLIWNRSTGGELDKASNWNSSKMPSSITTNDVAYFRYAQATNLYFSGTDPVHWRSLDFIFGDGVPLRFTGVLDLGAGNTWLATPMNNTYPVRFGSTFCLKSGTMGYTEDVIKDMIVGGDGRLNGHMIIDGPNSTWQMAKGMTSRFGYGTTADDCGCSLVVTNGGTFIGPLLIGYLSTNTLVHVTGSGSTWRVPADYTKFMSVGGNGSFSTAIISDGARFEDFSSTTVMLGYGKTYGRCSISNNLFRIEGGSSFYANGKVHVGALSAGGGWNKFEVLSGSKAVIGNEFVTAAGEDSSTTLLEHNNEVLVSGTGTELVASNHVYIGFRNSVDARFIIESNAVMRAKGRFHLGAESYGSCGTKAIIRDGGVLDMSESTEINRTIFVGWNGECHTNSLVIDNGTLYLTNGVTKYAIQTLGGRDNTIEVKNNGRLIAKETKMSIGASTAGIGSKFIVRDGGCAEFVYTSANNENIVIGSSAPYAELLVDNGTLLASNMYIRSSHGGAGATNSLIRVINGGRLCAKRFLVGNYYTAAMAITNGYVSTKNDGLQFGQDGGTNNHLYIGGTNSFIDIVNGSVTTKNGATFDIGIPKEGVSAAHPIIQANRLLVTGENLKLNLSVEDEYVGPREVTIFKTLSYDIDYSTVDITVNAPEGTELIKNPRELKLRIPRHFGLCIFVH